MRCDSEWYSVVGVGASLEHIGRYTGVVFSITAELFCLHGKIWKLSVTHYQQRFCKEKVVEFFVHTLYTNSACWGSAVTDFLIPDPWISANCLQVHFNIVTVCNRLTVFQDQNKTKIRLNVLFPALKISGFLLHRRVWQIKCGKLCPTWWQIEIGAKDTTVPHIQVCDTASSRIWDSVVLIQYPCEKIKYHQS